MLLTTNLRVPLYQHRACTYRQARSLTVSIEAKMVKATWQGVTLAESNSTKQVEGNHYFPPDALLKQYFKPSQTTSVCGWKGTAHYWNVEVDGQVNKDAAWYYDTPKDAAKEIKDYVAFWKGVQVK